MLLTDFKNYQEFKEKYGQDSSIRMSLAIDVIKTLNKTKNGFSINTNTGITEFPKGVASFSEWTLANLIIKCLEILNNPEGSINIMGYTFFADGLATDERNGVPTKNDDNASEIRVIKISKIPGRIDRPVTLKSGKLLREIILNNEYVSKFSERSITFLCERFSFIWKSYCLKRTIDDYSIIVDKNFKKIYSANEQEGNFGSCMNDVGHHSFYNCIDASAVSLYNKSSEKMIARCILYNDVYSINENKHYRLAERQYSTSDKYRQILIDCLISEGYIDGYKAIGAGCNDGRNFIKASDGSSLKDDLIIGFDPHANGNDFAGLQTISYMDTFKYMFGNPSNDENLKCRFNNRYNRFLRNYHPDTSFFNFSGTGNMAGAEARSGVNIDNLTLEMGSFKTIHVYYWSKKHHEYRQITTNSDSSKLIENGFYKCNDNYYNETILCKKCGTRSMRNQETTCFEIETCPDCTQYCELLEDYFDKNKLIKTHSGEWIPFEFSARNSKNHIIMNPMLLQFVMDTKKGIYTEGGSFKELTVRELLKQILINLWNS